MTVGTTSLKFVATRRRQRPSLNLSYSPGLETTLTSWRSLCFGQLANEQPHHIANIHEKEKVKKFPSKKYQCAKYKILIC